jgi:hypothetical protein
MCMRRGVKFNHMVVDCFTFHVYDSISAMCALPYRACHSGFLLPMETWTMEQKPFPSMLTVPVWCSRYGSANVPKQECLALPCLPALPHLHRHTGCKKDPRSSVSTARDMELSNLRFAIRNGDVHALKFQCVSVPCGSQ